MSWCVSTCFSFLEEKKQTFLLTYFLRGAKVVSHMNEIKLKGDAHIGFLVGSMKPGQSFRVKTGRERKKVLQAAKFAGKDLSSRTNDDKTFTIFAV